MSLLATKEKVTSITQENTIKQPEQLLHLSASPHLRHVQTVPHIMKDVLIALTPAIISSLIFFRFSALFIILVSTATAVLTEYLICILSKKQSTLSDMSAVVTGLIMGLIMPPAVPIWVVAIGSVFAIGVVKVPFGGLGRNFVNPAISARLFLMIVFPTAMMSMWKAPINGSMSGIDGISTATPLAHFQAAIIDGTFEPLDLQEAFFNLFLGNTGGCIGETSIIAILLGAFWLWYRRIISFRIPLSFIGTAFLLFWFFNGSDEHFTTSAIIIPVYQILAGGLIFGAFFNANDTVTTPITPMGKILFGVGCGAIVFIIRHYTAYPEGVCIAIFVMNLAVPIIERYTRPKFNGRVPR